MVFGQVFTAVSGVFIGRCFSAMPAGAAAFVGFAAAILAFDKPTGSHDHVPAIMPVDGDPGCAEEHAKSQGDMDDADKHEVPFLQIQKYG